MAFDPLPLSHPLSPEEEALSTSLLAAVFLSPTPEEVPSPPLSRSRHVLAALQENALVLGVVLALVLVLGLHLLP